MTLLVSDSLALLLSLFSLVFKVFEDGSTHRGRLKLLGRIIVKTYYEDVLQPDITEGHNSDQATMIIRDKVTTILDDSSFLLASEPDENVSFKNHSCHDAKRLITSYLD
jgi:hypothetical protein